jgi:hypothetical protein
MIHDAVVRVSCDGDGCSEEIEIQPEFVYRDYSGRSGYYDTSDEAIEKKVAQEGWFAQGDKHYCESCGPEDMG